MSSMSGTDALTLLRDWCQGRRRIRYFTHHGDEYVAFDDYAFLKSGLTPLEIYSKQKEYYDLGSLIFFFENKDMVHSLYVRESAAKGLKAITRTNRREILEFLQGNRSDLPSFYDHGLPPLAPVSAAKLKESASTSHQHREPHEPERKKARHEEHTKTPGKEKEQIQAVKKEESHGTLTAEQIANLKKKKLLHQKKKTQAAEAGGEVEELDVQTAPPVEQKLFKGAHERVWLTRFNCMDSLTKDFSNVADLVNNMKPREDPKDQKPKTTAAPSRPVPSKSNRPQPGYSRYDQEVFSKEINADFNIDTEVSFVGQNLNNISKVVAKPIDIPTVKPMPVAPVKPVEPPMPKKRTNRTPIIIIPPSGGMGGTLINMYNVRDILQDMTFKTPDEKKASGQKREMEVQLHRKRGDVTVPYRVVENPQRLTEDEWDRVVAVFVMGPAWQFKGWKWNGNPVEIFSHIPAFHLHYDDLKIDKNVAQWSVTFIPISREKRHLDKARLAKFWETLDRHILKHKNYLRA